MILILQYIDQMSSDKVNKRKTLFNSVNFQQIVSDNRDSRWRFGVLVHCDIFRSVNI